MLSDTINILSGSPAAITNTFIINAPHEERNITDNYFGGIRKKYTEL
jgi:hypothetical protein